jgi:hypothetical protein
MTQDLKLTTEESAAVEKGKRIGFLIASLDLPEAEKEQMLQLITAMNPAQLDVLSEALENNFLAQSATQAEENLAEGVREVAEEYAENMQTAQDKANDALSKIEAQLEK